MSLLSKLERKRVNGAIRGEISHRDQQILAEREQMVKSLFGAVQRAGGCPDMFDSGDITLNELVDDLAQNGIRFVFDHFNEKCELYDYREDQPS